MLLSESHMISILSDKARVIEHGTLWRRTGEKNLPRVGTLRSGLRSLAPGVDIALGEALAQP